MKLFITKHKSKEADLPDNFLFLGGITILTTSLALKKREQDKTDTYACVVSHNVKGSVK